MELRYLYVGTDDTEREVSSWLALPNARLRWRFRHFGADVAAIEIGGNPVVLLADHRPVGSVLPIYAVIDLDAEIAMLLRRGWRLDVGPMGTPEGPACALGNESGTTIALLQVDRPGAMETSYADEKNEHAVRTPPIE